MVTHEFPQFYICDKTQDEFVREIYNIFGSNKVTKGLGKKEDGNVLRTIKERRCSTSSIIITDRVINNSISVPIE